MCKFCQTYGKSASEMALRDAFITQSAKYTYVGDGREYAVPLNFCPACGRTLSISLREAPFFDKRPCPTCRWNCTCNDFLFKECANHEWYHYQEAAK